jgi:hypothetical protein
MPALITTALEKHSDTPFANAAPAAAAADNDAANMVNQLFLGRSMRDGIAFSVMSGADETCLFVYALFLKATSEQIACWLRCRR